MPSWAASLVCVVAAYLLIVGLALVLVVATARFAALLPTYADDFCARASHFVDWLTGLGVEKAQIDKIAGSFDLSRSAASSSALLSGALAGRRNLAFILTLVLFMTMDGGTFPRQLEPTPRSCARA